MIFLTRSQFAVRVGSRIAGIRGPGLRAYYSERNRVGGWRVLPLARGWRAFYRKDPSA